jgi:Subtilase family
MLSRSVAVVVGVVMAVAAAAGPAQAKTYNDPWVENDLQQMRVPDALDILARTPQHVIVGDVDSGARLSDPDLAPHLLRMSSPYTCTDEYGPGPDYGADPGNGDFGCDFIGSGDESVPSTIPDGDPTDPYGHGTGTAEIIAGVANNGLEGAGVAPNARVLPVRACYGGNPDCYNEPALDGLTYAVAMGASIINASWPPGDDYSADFRSFIHDHPNVLFDFAIGGSDQNDDP